MLRTRRTAARGRARDVNTALQDLVLKRAVLQQRWENAAVADLHGPLATLRANILALVTHSGLYPEVKRPRDPQHGAFGFVDPSRYERVKHLIGEVGLQVAHFLHGAMGGLKKDLAALAQVELHAVPKEVQAILDQHVAKGQGLAEAVDLAEADECTWVTIKGNHVCITGGHTHEGADAAGEARKVLGPPTKPMSEAIDPDTGEEIPDTFAAYFGPGIRPALSPPEPLLLPPLFRAVPTTYITELLGTPLGGAFYATSFADLGARLVTGIRNVLLAGLVSGEGVPNLTRRLQAVMGNADYQAERIVRSEFGRVSNQANLATYAQNADLIQSVQWVSTLDADTCLQCGELDGRTWESMAAAPIPVADTHPNCYVPTTTVEGEFLFATRLWYSGPVIDLETRQGLRLTVTPNHPVLTVEGLRPAKLIREGDDVVSRRLRIGCEDDEHVPPTIEEVFRSIRQHGFGQPARRREEDLHGDAAAGQGDIDVVAVDRMLLADGVALAAQYRRHPVFETAAVEQPSHAALRAADQFIERSPLPSYRLVGRSDLGRPATGRHLTPFRAFGSRAATDLYARTLEASDQGVAANAGLVSKLLRGHPGFVTLDQVVKIERRKFDGYVYDLQSTSGLMVAGGIVASNCRCRLVPVVKDADSLGLPPGSRASFTGQVPETLTYDDWFDQQSEAFQKDVLGPTRFDLYRSGRADLSDFANASGVHRIRDVLASLAEAIQEAEAACQWITKNGVHICITGGHQHATPPPVRSSIAPTKEELGFVPAGLTDQERQAWLEEQRRDGIAKVEGLFEDLKGAETEVDLGLRTWDSLSDDEKQEIQDNWVSEHSDEYYDEAKNAWLNDTGRADAERELVRDTDWADQAIADAIDAAVDDPGLRSRMHDRIERLDRTDREQLFAGNLDLDQALQRMGLDEPAHGDFVLFRTTASEAWDRELQQRVDALEVPEQVRDDADQAARDAFDDLSPSELNDLAGGDRGTWTIADPEEWVVSAEEGQESQGYAQTHAIAKALVEARAKQLWTEGLGARTPPDFAQVGENFWDAWKRDSYHGDALAMHRALVEELAANSRGQETGVASRRSLTIDPDVEDRIYARALWDTTQFLLSKANVREMDLYRSVILPAEVVGREEQVAVTGGGTHFTKLPKLVLQQNPAQSFTLDRTVANAWSGVSSSPPGGQRVVIRAKVPSTAIWSVPVYGENIHSEQEAVILGTPWKAWDAWKGSAPTPTRVLIEWLLEGRMPPTYDRSIITQDGREPDPDAFVIDFADPAQTGGKHWLTHGRFEAQSQEAAADACHWITYHGRKICIAGGHAHAGDSSTVVTTTEEAALSPKNRAKFEKALASYHLTREGMHAEILSKISNADGTINAELLAEARHWYPDAHAFATDLTGKADITLEQAVGVIAALSPQNPWEYKTQYGTAGNKYDAAAVVKYYAEHAGDQQTPAELAAGLKALYDPNGATNADHHLGSAIFAPTPSIEKAFAILRDGSAANLAAQLGTLKTASFYNNILAPGQTRAVTVDGHMAKALAYTALAQGIRMPKDGPGPKGDRIGSVMSAMDGRVWGSVGHVLIADQVRKIADTLHESPDTIQAAYWLVVQPRNPFKEQDRYEQPWRPGAFGWRSARAVSEAQQEPPQLLVVRPDMPWGDGLALEPEDIAHRLGLRREDLLEAIPGACQWITKEGRHICITAGHGEHGPGEPKVQIEPQETETAIRVSTDHLHILATIPNTPNPDSVYIDFLYNATAELDPTVEPKPTTAPASRRELGQIIKTLVATVKQRWPSVQYITADVINPRLAKLMTKMGAAMKDVGGVTTASMPLTLVTQEALDALDLAEAEILMEAPAALAADDACTWITKGGRHICITSGHGSRHGEAPSTALGGQLPKMASYLVDQGWTAQSASPAAHGRHQSIVYTHPEYGTVTAFANGDWVFEPFDGEPTHGHRLFSLKAHLLKVGLLEARGFRAMLGPHWDLAEADADCHWITKNGRPICITPGHGHAPVRFADSLGIERKAMPQIWSRDMPEFLAYAAKRGVPITRELTTAADLHPAQAHYNPDQVVQLKAEMLAKPLVISKDNYVLDGTHRWVRLTQDDPHRQIQVIRIGLPATQAIALMHSFPKVGHSDISQIGGPAHLQPALREAADACHWITYQGRKICIADGHGRHEPTAAAPPAPKAWGATATAEDAADLARDIARHYGLRESQVAVHLGDGPLRKFDEWEFREGGHYSPETDSITLFTDEHTQFQMMSMAAHEAGHHEWHVFRDEAQAEYRAIEAEIAPSETNPKHLGTTVKERELFVNPVESTLLKPEARSKFPTYAAQEIFFDALGERGRPEAQKARADIIAFGKAVSPYAKGWWDAYESPSNRSVNLYAAVNETLAEIKRRLATDWEGKWPAMISSGGTLYAGVQITKGRGPWEKLYNAVQATNLRVGARRASA